eukprot:TRINITY_DN9297_c0_g1_i1.p2 TRINITY_DN9297_c0_g1~~TRINITY_DN9297_c0_g1_i1.p2  ORF type:complete len:455 (-),score=57.95 TRINITY_DN9297_c0_g1_i1:548-1912(-)
MAMLTGQHKFNHVGGIEQNGNSQYATIEDCVGNTPLVRLQRLPGNTTNTILAKLEGNNPAGSVKDRPALSMITEAERKGVIKPGDTLIEATSGNTGIALAMVAAIKGYKMKLIMPSNMSEERKASMRAYGAELIDVPPGKIEMARDLALEMQAEGKGIVLDQFGNTDNPLGHFSATGPEIWRQTNGRITHFVSSMGTTGTIMGTSRYLKEMNPDIKIVGLQPGEGASIPGIRRWPEEYLPKFFEAWRLDRIMEITQTEAEETMRALARCEGIFAGVSSGGALSAALRLSQEVENATIVAIVCDRGDRYLSTGVFSAEASASDPKPCTLEEYGSAISRLEPAYPGPHYVLFTASLDPETQIPWCPDCARSLSIIRESVGATGGTLLEVMVGDRPTWKSPDHPFRQYSTLQLTGIPTLMRWYDGKPVARTGNELEKAADADEAKRVVDDFVSETNL